MDDNGLSAADPLLSGVSAAASAPDHGWQKVTYTKRQRKPAPAAAPPQADQRPNGSHVFASVEQKALERRRAIESAAAEAAAAAAAATTRSRPGKGESDEEDDDSGAEGAVENGVPEGEVKKVNKVKKPKKPKVTVPEAASKIDAGDLAAFLAEVSASYETQQGIQLMRFADYFGRAFSSVSASQFPWTKLFKESPVAKIVDVPLSHISESVYKTSAEWIGHKSPEALGEFVLWSLDGIFTELASQQAAAKGSKKSVPQPSSKSQVAIFVVLAMTLRRKPDVLINLLPKLRDTPKYQGQEKLPVIIWSIAQASQGDLVVGVYSWAHYLLPLICAKSTGNPQSRDLVLQLLERILSGAKARTILLNGAVRKGERIVPPSALDLLIRAAFPVPSARVKATERFEAVYPILKELALAGSAGTKTTKQATQQLLPFMVKAMSENNPDLTKEAADIFIWCLTQNPDCYKQWEKYHLENVDASVAVLRKLSEEWKNYSSKLAPLHTLRDTLKDLKAKHEEALSGEVDANHQASLKTADKYCKLILGRLTHRFGCGKGGICVLTLAVAIGGFLLTPALESINLKELQAIFNFP